jgi:hypothetical protein
MTAARQTASLTSVAPQLKTTTPSAPLAGPVVLSLDAFRAAATTPVDDRAGALVPPVDNTSSSNDPPQGARFVPLLKADQPAETNNKATFVQQHEFGVQLRSNF